MRKAIFVNQIIILILGLIILTSLLVLFAPPGFQKLTNTDRNFTLLSFDDFDNLVGGKDRLDQSHRLLIFDQYRGKYVSWHGEVYQKERTAEGDYLLRIKHGVNRKPFEVTLILDLSEKENWENLNRGEAVSYTGKLVSFDPEVGYYLENGDIE
jgi:hypothetical protein